MFNLNGIMLIGNTWGDPKVTPNGPTTLFRLPPMSLGRTSKPTNAARGRNGNQRVIWNGLGKWAATLPKGTPLFVEGELVYERYPRKVEPPSERKPPKSKS